MRPDPLWQLTLARLRMFFREPSAVFWTFGFPLALSVALGVAFRNKPPDPVAVGVWSGPDSTASPRVLEVLRGTPGVAVSEYYGPDTRDLSTGKIALFVRPGARIEYDYDPNRPESRLAREVVDSALQRAAGRADALPTVDKPVAAPGSRYIDFLIPGLIGMNIMSGSMWGIGYVVVEMRTRKLLKRLMATPMSRAQFLTSFVLMRAAFFFIELPLLLLFGWFAFGVGVAGSLTLLVGLSLLGALAFAGLGLLVAARAQNTQTVSGLINLVMLPMFIGSGVFFSTARFPDVFQPFLRALPLTALNDSVRAVMIEGAGPRAVAGQAALLIAIGGVSFALALRLFRWR
jgi:ABC-2 type transport system permease protein